MNELEIQKNGLTERLRETRVSKILGGITAAYLVLCFLAPAILPAGSVPELSGRANAIDYAYHDSWGNGEHEQCPVLVAGCSIRNTDGAWATKGSHVCRWS